MKHYIGVTALLIAASAVMGGSLACLFAQEHPASLSAREISQPAADSFAYLLKEHGGYLAVYRNGQEQPEMILQVLVRNLPEQDQKALAQGIGVADYQELVMRLEDYSS